MDPSDRTHQGEDLDDHPCLAEPEEPVELLADAPSWPQESTFRAFHDEIADRAGLPAR